MDLLHKGSSRFEGRGLSASRVMQSYQVLEELRPLLKDRDPDALVFPSHRRGYLTSTEFRWVFDRAAREVGMATCTTTTSTPSPNGWLPERKPLRGQLRAG
ncbi:hypothetical protein ACWEOI_27805 [Nocardia sp. NPDC004340]